ncbi:MAG TPA: restriction endonuclease subunit S [Rhodoferax sp.]|nr:restriction endonuclease subunit S [Rhodoferax sp.]
MSEWVHSNVGAVTLYQRAGGTPTATTDAYYGGEIPFVTIEDITNGTRYLDKTVKNLSELGLRTSAAWLVKEPHVLYSMYATVGKPIVNRIACATNQAIIALKASEAVEQDFLFYQLLFIRPQVYKFTSQTTQSNLNASSVRKLPIAYPKSRATQRKIASILSTIDTAIEQTEALIEKYQHIKAGLMHDLFTRGVLPNGQLRPPREQAPELYQETAIGWVPREWQYELLDNLSHRGSGHTPNKDHPEYWNGGIKWVSLADSNKLDQLYISDTELEISHKGIVNSSAVLHPAGIVVLSRDAGVGKSAITTEPMAVSQHFMCWKCDQKMDNHFLYYWLQFNKRTFENIAMGSTILTIGLPYFKRLRIACPVELAEQQAIAKKLKSADTRIIAMRDHLAKLRKQKLGLMQDLLTGKVPVKADAENPELVGA